MAANALFVDSGDDRARVVGHVDLDRQGEYRDSGKGTDDDFLDAQAAGPWTGDRLQQDHDRILAEISELQSKNRWDDMS